MLRHVPLALAALLTFAVGTATADVINVPGDYAQIHDAVQAAIAGDTVMVAAGTYNDCTHETEGPGSTPACVIMKAGVTLMGAGRDQTIIDAQGLGRGIFVEDADDVRIQDLQVRGAYAEIYGAGILVRQASTGTVIENCDIRLNGDGGIVVIDDSAAAITGVQFVDNEAKQGGGLAVEEASTATVDDCLFDNNTAPSGAGMFVRSGSTVTITGTIFDGNDINADFGNGGGLAVTDSHCDVSGCEFLANTTRGNGGGLAYVSNATGTVEDCYIAGNSTEASFNYGGGISCQFSAVTFRNLVLVDNTATSSGSDGGGLDIQFDPAPTVDNCTFVNNAAAEGGFGDGILLQWGVQAEITNCIVTGSPGQGIGADDSIVDPMYTVTGCDIWSNGDDTFNGADGGCNFSADPLFCNAAEGNYRIEPASPCSPGNHPLGGECGVSYVGAFAPGCGTPVQDLPESGLVLGNAPNPFNPMTTVFFVLDAPGDVVVRIHDLRGHTLRTFRRSGLAAATRYEITWNGRDEQGRELPSGVYLYQLESHGQRVTERMSLIR